MTKHTHPAAEKFARTMKLPVVIDALTKELYGYCNPVLDEIKARTMLASAGFPVGTPANDAAMDIIRERADALSK